MRTSPCKVTDHRKLESAATACKWLHCNAVGCESGRQDSNLRPLVPQTSPYFPPCAEFDLECFCPEMVGNTTSARIGIRWNRVEQTPPLVRTRFVQHVKGQL